jgi:plastocyanin
MKTRITGSLVVCGAAALFTAGALIVNADSGSSSSTPAPAAAGAPAGPYGRAGAPAAAPGATLEIKGFSFSAVNAAPGSTVTVVNGDGLSHTVTATDKAFNTGPVKGGASTSFVAPAAPGTYSFFCAIHPDMQGTLTVG